MEITAIGNAKGGTGKTTTAVNLAACLAHRDIKTLLVDFDPQGSATAWLGVSSSGGELIGSLEQGKATGLVSVRHGLDLLPGGADLAELAGTLPPTALRDLLRPLRRSYGSILIDCPPSVGRLIANALIAADSVLVPCECSYLALAGLAQFQAVVERAKVANPRLYIRGVLPTRSSRTVHSREAIKMLIDAYGELVQKAVPEAVALRDAAGTNRTILETAPDSMAGLAYTDLAAWIMEGKVKA